MTNRKPPADQPVTFDALHSWAVRQRDAATMMDQELMYLAGDVERYLTAWDRGNAPKADDERLNMRARILGIRMQLRKTP